VSNKTGNWGVLKICFAVGRMVDIRKAVVLWATMKQYCKISLHI